MILESSNDWRLAVIMDAHATNESVITMTELVEDNTDKIHRICDSEVNIAIPELQEFITRLVTSKIAVSKSKEVKGETAALFCFEKNGYLWWLSIGDNSLYVLHKEFNELGQFRLNQRIFYQWYGEKNSLSLQVPCYTSGIIQLREGNSIIIMLTDGVLEIKNRVYEDESELAKVFESKDLSVSIREMLTEVKRQKGRDSATVIAWNTVSTNEVLRPTRL